MGSSGSEPRRDVVTLVVAGREASRIIEERRNARERRGPIVAVLARALGCPEVLTALAALGDLEQQSLDAGIVDQLQAARREPLCCPVGRRRKLGDEVVREARPMNANGAAAKEAAPALVRVYRHRQRRHDFHGLEPDSPPARAAAPVPIDVCDVVVDVPVLPEGR